MSTQRTNEAKYLWPKLQVINYNSERGGVSVITEKGEITTSYLLIQDAQVSDSGKYSCSPSNADVAAVRVHVLNGMSAISFYPSLPPSLVSLSLQQNISSLPFEFPSKSTLQSEWNMLITYPLVALEGVIQTTRN